MNVAAVAGLIRRRGTVVGWMHASPLPADDMDPFTRGPRASLGGEAADGLQTGAFGERYADEVRIRALTSGKIADAFLQQYGFVEGGDMQVTMAVPFRADTQAGIAPLSQYLEDVYNAGGFTTVAGSATTVAFDRFRFIGRLWIAKAPAVPIIDGDVVVAWRVLVTKLTT